MPVFKRLRNLWAWSSYHPSETPPSNVGFTWTGKKTPINAVEKPKMAQIIKRSDPKSDFLKENE